jgi:hypothetical protein
MGPTKPFSAVDDAGVKQGSAIIAFDQTTGRDHVGIHHQSGLRPFLQEVPRRHGTAPTSVDLRQRPVLAPFQPVRSSVVPFDFRSSPLSRFSEVLIAFVTKNIGRFTVKTIAVVLTLAISGIAISAAYTEAYASRMNGKGGWCSEGTNCMSGRQRSPPLKLRATPNPRWATRYLRSRSCA